VVEREPQNTEEVRALHPPCRRGCSVLQPGLLLPAADCCEGWARALLHGRRGGALMRCWCPCRCSTNVEPEPELEPEPDPAGPEQEWWEQSELTAYCCLLSVQLTRCTHAAAGHTGQEQPWLAIARCRAATGGRSVVLAGPATLEMTHS
jgi:hypothetical protein